MLNVSMELAAEIGRHQPGQNPGSRFTDAELQEVRDRLNEAAYWLDSDAGDRNLYDDSGETIMQPVDWRPVPNSVRAAYVKRPSWSPADGWGHAETTDGRRIPP
jgi:hypothetical protein